MAVKDNQGPIKLNQLSAVAPDGLDAWREAFRIVQAREVWESYGDFVRSAKPEFGPGIKERIAFAATAEQADAARKVMRRRAPMSAPSFHPAR
jgi:amidase